MVSLLPSALDTQICFCWGYLKEEEKEQTLKEQTLLPRVKLAEQQLTGEACEPPCQLEISHGLNQGLWEGAFPTSASLRARQGAPARAAPALPVPQAGIAAAETALPLLCLPLHPLQLREHLGINSTCNGMRQVLSYTSHPPFSLFHSEGCCFCLAAAKFLFLSSSPDSSMRNESQS